MVERFFRDITDYITEKSFASAGKQADAIIGLLSERNWNAKGYIWQAEREDILRNIEAAQLAMAAA